MLRFTGQLLRAANASGSTLRRKLKLLKNHERRMLSDKKRRDRCMGPSCTEAKPHDLSILPQNKRLEMALANVLLTKGDARAKLEFARRFEECQLMSLASPVSVHWDPYDIKPQAFALNTFLGLPMFTSLTHLRAFCDKFGLRVCDPAGVPWTRHATSERLAELEHGTSGGAKADSNKDSHGKQWTRRTWADTQRIASFSITQATPLQTYGPFVLPHFVGYFGDVRTVLHNITIIPDSIDIVLNPTTPLEFVIAREMANRILQKEDILQMAYRRVERVLRAEFHQFLAQHCPEVDAALSACLPIPAVVEPEGDTHEILILIDTPDWNSTIAAITRAKNAKELIGHRALHLLPLTEAPDHIRAVGTVFYDGNKHSAQRLDGSYFASLERERRAPQRRRALNYGFFQSAPCMPPPAAADQEAQEPPQQPRVGATGFAFRQIGAAETIQCGVASDSYFADPSMAYTEPWALRRASP